ncbi:MAG TPA: nitroreductase [Frankiaceae bacterium]|nr:nitroreductase [Frankiaceae bacterium]
MASSKDYPLVDWRSVDGEGPLSAEAVEYVVAVATLAPSIHNTQPWRFVWRDGSMELYADRARQLAVADPDGRQLHLSCGAALLQARLAVRGLGRRVTVRLLPDPADPDLLARLEIGPSEPGVPTPEEWALLHAAYDRHTQRAAFEPRRLTRPLLVDLVRAVEEEGAGLHLVEWRGERVGVAQLLAGADRRQESDPAYQAELRRWSRFDDATTDGIPRTAVGRGRRAMAHAEFVQRDFDVDGSVGAQEAHDEPPRGPEEPDVALLYTARDTPRDWLVGGMALCRLLLAATCAGVAASLLDQPVELRATRELLRWQTGIDGYPQVMLRLGYAEPAPPTPRRPVGEVLERRSPVPE